MIGDNEYLLSMLFWNVYYEADKVKATTKITKQRVVANKPTKEIR